MHSNKLTFFSKLFLSKFFLAHLKVQLVLRIFKKTLKLTYIRPLILTEMFLGQQITERDACAFCSVKMIRTIKKCLVFSECS